MSKNTTSQFYLSKAIGDFFFLLLLFISILFFKYKGLGLPINAFINISASFYKELIVIFSTWYLLSGYTKIYSHLITTSFITFLKRIILQFSLFSIIFLALLNDEKSFFLNKNQSILAFCILFFYLSLSRFLYVKALKHSIKSGKYQKNTIIIGINNNSSELINLIQKHNEFGLSIKNIFPIETNSESKVIFDFKLFSQYLLENNINQAYISLENNIHHEFIKNISEMLEDMYISIGFIPNMTSIQQQSLEISYLDTFPILTYKKHPLDHSFNQIIKRTFDIVFTLIAFATLLWWLLPIITLAVYISQGGPILFAQKRNGLNGKEFNCLKFRTMKPHKLNDLKPTERNDPRVTKLGKILRKTSLDELPQFFNVLKGEMSIVGPRPHMVSENESYSEVINRYSLRHYVKPGITGLAQVRGYRGAVDTDKDMELRIRTDIYYVRNWSFLLDLLIIYKTVKLMIVGDENAI